MARQTFVVAHLLHRQTSYRGVLPSLGVFPTVFVDNENRQFLTPRGRRRYSKYLSRGTRKVTYHATSSRERRARSVGTNIIIKDDEEPEKNPYTNDSPSELIVSKLSKRTKSWKRFRHFFELIELIPNPSSLSHFDQNVKSQLTPLNEGYLRAVDIGCDHGLLTLGLAASGRFRSVLGVDVSKNALKGAINNLQQVSAFNETLNGTNVFSQQYANTFSSPFATANVSMTNDSAEMTLNNGCHVSFKLGDGLLVLEDSSEDVACLAGMGVNTMMRILFARLKGIDGLSAITEIERVGCHHIMVQPTNSRPRRLICLYDALQDAGFHLIGERIVLLQSRWYITALFSRTVCASTDEGRNITPALPGDILNSLPSHNCMKQDYEAYVKLHVQWLQSVIKNKGLDALCEQDQRWLKLYGHKQR